jgi:hypothetical protein
MLIFYKIKKIQIIIVQKKTYGKILEKIKDLQLMIFLI